MPHADRPYPLAGVDQALGEGSARPPAELLDQLRERLRRLDPNHPSASPRSPEPDVAADSPASQEAAPEENAEAWKPDRSSLRKEGPDSSSRDDRASDQGAGEPPAVGDSGQPTVAAVDGVANGLVSGGHYGVIDAGRAAEGQAYRPWFADEPGTPWFAEPDFTD